MKKRLSTLAALAITLIFGLAGCGDTRSLQSVSISRAVASSTAQFTATGLFNKMPTSTDITASTTWCIGSSTGFCAGNIDTGATVNSGIAQCHVGFTGTVTVLAGGP